MARKLVGKQMGGYPAFVNGRWVLQDGYGKTVSQAGRLIGCSPLRPGMPGAWIDTKRCSYNFKVGGTWYTMRGYGEGIAAGGRAMKKPPKGFSGR
jgi:hypothetical protein